MSTIQVVPRSIPKDWVHVTDADLEQERPVHRVSVTTADLAGWFGCSEGFLKLMIRAGNLREQKTGLDLGLSSEELCALGLACELACRHEIAVDRCVGTARQVFDQVLSAVGETRVCLVLTKSNQEDMLSVGTGEGLLEVDPTLRSFVWIYDATKYRDLIEDAIVAQPLRIPAPKSAESYL